MSCCKEKKGFRILLITTSQSNKRRKRLNCINKKKRPWFNRRNTNFPVEQESQCIENFNPRKKKLLNWPIVQPHTIRKSSPVLKRGVNQKIRRRIVHIRKMNLRKRSKSMLIKVRKLKRSLSLHVKHLRNKRKHLKQEILRRKSTYPNTQKTMDLKMWKTLSKWPIIRSIKDLKKIL